MIIDRYLNPMYPIALEVRKTLFKTYVFRESAWGRDVMAYYYPYRPNTPDQVAWSNHFAQAVFDWQGFDESTKSYYNKMRYPTHMSGYNRYISYYLRQIDLMPTYWGALEKSSEDATLIQTLLDLKANIADVFIGKIKVGTESIGATDTSKVITFSEEFAAKYTVRPGGINTLEPWRTAIAVDNITNSSMTIHFTAPGGYGSTLYWVAIGKE